MPQATPGGPEARGQRAAARAPSTPAGASTQRERKKVAVRPAHRRPVRLVDAEHHVQVLDRLAGGALPEVVDRGEHEHAPVRQPRSRGCGRGSCRARRARPAARSASSMNGSSAVGVGEQRPPPRRRRASRVGGHVAARQQALVERQQVRHEGRRARRSPSAASSWSISGAWRCPSTAYGVHVLVHRHEVRARRSPRGPRRTRRSSRRPRRPRSAPRARAAPAPGSRRSSSSRGSRPGPRAATRSRCSSVRPNTASPTQRRARRAPRTSARAGAGSAAGSRRTGRRRACPAPRSSATTSAAAPCG